MTLCYFSANPSLSCPAPKVAQKHMILIYARITAVRRILKVTLSLALCRVNHMGVCIHTVNKCAQVFISMLGNKVLLSQLAHDCHSEQIRGFITDISFPLFGLPLIWADNSL